MNPLDLLPRQMRTDGTTPIAPLGLSDSSTAVQLRLTGHMPLGRQHVKLQWQVAPVGTPFTAATGVISGASSAWTDTYTNGVIITQTVTGLQPDTLYHWRVRLVYPPGALGQSAGRWLYSPGNGASEMDFRTPVTETQAPLAGFYARPLSGFVPLTVTFTNSSTNANSYVWDYGDGLTGALSAITHTHVYTQPGLHTVVLSAGDGVVTGTLTRAGFITAKSFTTTTRVIGYSYDGLYRLTGAAYSTGQAFTYTYDAVPLRSASRTGGNRTAQTRTLTGTNHVTAYVYDSANRLDTFVEDSQTTDLSWDDGGNLLTQGTSVYTWDAAHRLIGATVEGVDSSFAYNGLGQRMARTVDGLTTAYVLDVGSELPEVIAATTGESATSYVQIQGQILAEIEEGTWEYALPDALGSLRQLADESGEVLLAQSFDPFGVLLQRAGSGGSEFGYTGEQVDHSTQLTFLRARYYSSAVGRFLSRDPFPGYVQRPASQHAYAYAFNDPILFTDPDGRCPACDVNPCLAGACDPDSEEATLWLLKTMRRNAASAITRLIYYYNWQEVTSGLDPLTSWVSGRILVKVKAYDLWISMVKTGAPWDFKVRIRYQQEGLKWGGERIRMCCGWYSYENIANIHCGFVGRTAGFSAFELKAGAGIFQWKDHHGEMGYEERRSRGDIGLSTHYDEPEDQAAIDVGIKSHDWNMPLTPTLFCNRVFRKFANRLK